MCRMSIWKKQQILFSVHERFIRKVRKKDT